MTTATTIKARAAAKRQTKIDVTLPVYRYHDCGSDHGDSAYYTRITEAPDGQFDVVEIGLSENYGDGEGVEYTFQSYRTRHFPGQGSEADYVAGTGSHALKPERFDQILAQVRAALAEIR